MLKKIYHLLFTLFIAYSKRRVVFHNLFFNKFRWSLLHKWSKRKYYSGWIGRKSLSQSDSSSFSHWRQTSRISSNKGEVNYRPFNSNISWLRYFPVYLEIGSSMVLDFFSLTFSNIKIIESNILRPSMSNIFELNQATLELNVRNILYDS